MGNIYLLGTGQTKVTNMALYSNEKSHGKTQSEEK